MKLTHTNENGSAIMVDIGDKDISQREARAVSVVQLSLEAYNAVVSNTVKKGDVLAVARIAGITAAKKTSELIPLCHNILLTSVTVDFELKAELNRIVIQSTAKTNGLTGVEMEAMTAASVSALTIYDMCKAIDKSIAIINTHLKFKSGGKSGVYSAE